MNNPFANMSTSDKEMLIRSTAIGAAVLVIFGLGYALGHRLKAAPSAANSQSSTVLPPTAAAPGEAIASNPGRIFNNSAETRRVITALPLHFGWAMHRGKNEVALDLTIINNNAQPVKDIELVCAFYNKNMKPLGTRKGVIGEAIEAKASKSFTRIPVPHMSAKAEHMACEIIDARL